MLITFVYHSKNEMPNDYTSNVDCFTTKKYAIAKLKNILAQNILKQPEDKINITILVNGKPKHTGSNPPVSDNEYNIHKELQSVCLT